MVFSLPLIGYYTCIKSRDTFCYTWWYRTTMRLRYTLVRYMCNAMHHKNCARITMKPVFVRLTQNSRFKCVCTTRVSYWKKLHGVMDVITLQESIV